MESLLFALAIVGFFMFIFGFFGMIIDDDFFEVCIGLVILGAGFMLIFGFTGLAVHEAKVQDSVNAAAEKQNVTLVTDQYSKHYVYEVIYGDCKIGAELDDGQLILAGSEPAKLLTPELVEQICSAEVAR